MGVRAFVTAVASLAVALPLAAPAFAADPPKLPPAAKRLSGPQITALLGGKTFSYQSFTFWGVVTGEVTYDFKTGTNHGTYALGSHHGTFDGQIHLSGDSFCYKTSSYSEKCDSIYVVDGDPTIYEVKPSGIVDSINMKVTPPA